MPNIGRSLRRAIRPLWIAGLGAAAWSNRTKVLRALGQKPAAKPTPEDSLTVFANTAVIDPTVVVQPTSSDSSTPAEEV
ncbi:MAG TPA: hypothetical protein PK020_09795 [Ilumatobacteraceae bacterium]|nr:hypothetical protein [Ilumatobacteraceae bacterium]HRB02727.1 hypothetical protein [Ilumatobacteraceae bacterium]